MIRVRRSDERGRTATDWLDSRHSFSFNRYYDPEYTGFGPLLVLNDDVIAPGTGFPMHGHRDMEIVTWVIAGSIEHADSRGNSGVVSAGEAQRMSAGTGIRHAEHNASAEETLRFIQIWVLPRAVGRAPSYGQRRFPDEERSNRLCAIAAGDGRAGALSLDQDAVIFVAVLDEGRQATHAIAEGRGAWLQVMSGSVRCGSHDLGEGDALSTDEAADLGIDALSDSSILFFDLPLGQY
jgi:quercetin 2,3-dioxygenase